LQNLDKRYIQELLIKLEEYKKEKKIEKQLYQSLKNQYTKALEKAQNKSTLTKGFATFQPIVPNIQTIKQSAEELFDHLTNIEKEITKIQKRFNKLDKLVEEKDSSRDVYESKKREYQALIETLQEEQMSLVNAVPESLEILIQALGEINQQIENIEIEQNVEGNKSKSLTTKKKEWEKIQKDVQETAKKLSEIVEINFEEYKEQTLGDLARKPMRQKDTIKADFQPLGQEIGKDKPSKKAKRITESISQKDKAVLWQGMTIGTYQGEITLRGLNYTVIKTDRPSLAQIKKFALTGPSRLRSSSNPQVIENKLKKMIANEYDVPEEEALYVNNVVKFVFDKSLGIDVLKLINSYYAAINSSMVRIGSNFCTVDESAEIFSIAETTGLLGRRVLAPDQSLIGVFHELYFDQETAELYALAFKGVPPPKIREIYRSVHNQNLSEGSFGDFRNEISQKLSIPIYEALTPSSIIRYCVMENVVSNLNQLVTLIESMNPRITKVSEIASFTTDGVKLQNYPQNTLPPITL
ncbi:MAG: hypothetical protein U9O98_05520, partial [Asgard group archaeon]|nr:hypothetical protein [Asgard group archaeon]